MKKLLILVIICSLCLSSCRMDIPTQEEKNWDLILTSAKQTDVVIAVDHSNTDYIEWLSDDFADYMMSTYQVSITVEQYSLERMLEQLKSDRSSQKTFGAYDVMILEQKGYDLLENEQLLYGPFIHNMPNTSLIQKKDDTFVSRNGIKTQQNVVPIGRQMLSWIYDSDYFYDVPQTYDQLIQSLETLEIQACYPDPRISKEGEAFLLGVVASKIDVARYIEKGVDLAVFEQEVREVLTPIFNNPSLFYDPLPTSFEEMETLYLEEKISLFLSMDYSRVGTMMKSYEYKDMTEAMVISPTGTYTSVGVIAKNAHNKSGAMTTLNALLDSEMQASKLKVNDMTVYDKDISSSFFSPLKKVRFHRTVEKYSKFIECVAPEFEPMLIQTIVSVWEDIYQSSHPTEEQQQMTTQEETDG